MSDTNTCNRIETIDGYSINIIGNEFKSANILKVSAGTNGYKGGDSGHGARMYIEFNDLAATNMKIKLNSAQDYKDVERIEIVFSGDTELQTAIEGLEFILNNLKTQLATER